MPEGSRLLRRWVLVGGLFAALFAPAVDAGAARVRGSVAGYQFLLNPVWEEAKEPDHHGFSFREPVPTVRGEFRRLFPHIPKELCVALLSATPQQPTRRSKWRSPCGLATVGYRLHWKAPRDCLIASAKSSIPIATGRSRRGSTIRRRIPRQRSLRWGWIDGVNATGSLSTPASPNAANAAWSLSASSHGAPICSNGCSVPRPTLTLVASKRQTPG